MLNKTKVVENNRLEKLMETLDLIYQLNFLPLKKKIQIYGSFGAESEYLRDDFFDVI